MPAILYTIAENSQEFQHDCIYRRDRRVSGWHEGWDAGGETARETENLAAWDCELGRGSARGQRNPGCWRGGAAEFQVFSFSESGHSDFQIRGLLCARRSHSGKGETACSIPVCTAVQYHWILEKSRLFFLCTLSEPLANSTYAPTATSGLDLGLKNEHAR